LEIRFSNRRSKPAGRIEELLINDITPNPYQNRTMVDNDSVNDLAESIKVHGILQPILVRVVDGQHVLVSGERRIRAAKIVGLEKIPAVVKEMTDIEAAAATLVENLQREDVSFLDEAAGFYKLNSDFGITQTEIARLIGKSQAYVGNKIRLLNLPETVREIISREIMITERHCRALLRLPSKDAQLLILEVIIKKKLNTEQTDLEVEKYVNESQPVSKQKRKMVVKDIRIFLNSINTAVEALRNTGIETEWQQLEGEEYYEYYIKIKK
jgi:ParB family transcriptional regulator, chromosome partitioning protein